MAHLVINSTTFDGLIDGTGNQSAWQPTGYSVVEHKVGLTLEAANGTRNRVERSVTKRVWTLEWATANLATMQAIRTIQRLYTTFAFTDIEANAYTCQTESDDFEFEHAFLSGATRYFNVTLTIYQV
jgi:hypothetical protein